jgi:hypothetical protein
MAIFTGINKQKVQPTTVRISSEMLAEIDWASSHLEMSRANFIRAWLDRGLRQWRDVDRHRVARSLEGLTGQDESDGEWISR